MDNSSQLILYTNATEHVPIKGRRRKKIVFWNDFQLYTYIFQYIHNN